MTTMKPPTCEEAFARLIQLREGLSYTPVVTAIDVEDGGDYQLGEYTWDHDNASVTVTYRDPAGRPGKKQTLYIDLENYQAVGPDGEDTGRSGFAGLIEDLLAAGITLPTES